MKLVLTSTIDFENQNQNLMTALGCHEVLVNDLTRPEYNPDSGVSYTNKEFTIWDASSQIKVSEYDATVTGSRGSLDTSATSGVFKKLKALHEEGMLKVLEYESNMPWLNPFHPHADVGEHPMTIPVLKLLHEAKQSIKSGLSDPEDNPYLVWETFKRDFKSLGKTLQESLYGGWVEPATVWYEWFGTIPLNGQTTTNWLTTEDNMVNLQWANPAGALQFYGVEVDSDDEE